jgi:hypothetical protein
MVVNGTTYNLDSGECGSQHRYTTCSSDQESNENDSFLSDAMIKEDSNCHKCSSSRRNLRKIRKRGTGEREVAYLGIQQVNPGMLCKMSLTDGVW